MTSSMTSQDRPTSFTTPRSPCVSVKAASSSNARAFCLSIVASASAAARSSAVSDAPSTFPRVSLPRASRPRRLPEPDPPVSGPSVVPNVPATPSRRASISAGGSKTCEWSLGAPARVFLDFLDLSLPPSDDEEFGAEPGIGGSRSGALAIRCVRRAGSGIEPPPYV